MTHSDTSGPTEPSSPNEHENNEVTSQPMLEEDTHAQEEAQAKNAQAEEEVHAANA